jgi:hypothetical protein
VKQPLRPLLKLAVGGARVLMITLHPKKEKGKREKRNAKEHSSRTCPFTFFDRSIYHD